MSKIEYKSKPMSIAIPAIPWGWIVSIILIAFIGYKFFEPSQEQKQNKYAQFISTIDSLTIQLQTEKSITDSLTQIANISQHHAFTLDSILKTKFNDHEKKKRINSVILLNDSAKNMFFAKWLSKGINSER